MSRRKQVTTDRQRRKSTKKVRGSLRLFDYVIFEYSSFLIGTFHAFVSFHLTEFPFIRQIKALSRATIQVPKRINQRWLRERRLIGREAHSRHYQYPISRSLATVGISREEFALRWRRVQPEIPDDELFSMFNKAFGTPYNRKPKLKFVQEILRRYKAIIERVRLSV